MEVERDVRQVPEVSLQLESELDVELDFDARTQQHETATSPPRYPDNRESSKPGTEHSTCTSDIIETKSRSRSRSAERRACA